MSREPLVFRESKLAQSAQPGTIKVQQPNTNNTNHAQTTQQTRTLGHAQVTIQRMREQHTTTGQSASKEVVCSKQRSGILRVTKRDIDKDGLHDDKHRGAVHSNTDGGHDPVNGGSGSPCEEEQTDRGTKGCGQSGQETVFLDGEAEAGDAWVNKEVEVGSVGDDADEAGDEDAEEDEADFAEGHVVVDGVDEGEDLEDWAC